MTFAKFIIKKKSQIRVIDLNKFAIQFHHCLLPRGVYYMRDNIKFLYESSHIVSVKKFKASKIENWIEQSTYFFFLEIPRVEWFVSISFGSTRLASSQYYSNFSILNWYVKIFLKCTKRHELQESNEFKLTWSKK